MYHASHQYHAFGVIIRLIQIKFLSGALFFRENEEWFPHSNKAFIVHQDMSWVQSWLPGRDDG